jgi:hypothetical protein
MPFIYNNRSAGAVVSFNLVPSHTVIDEGEVLSILLVTTGVSEGTQIPYSITRISQEDLSSGSLTGNFTIGTGGEGTISLTIAADQLTEGPEVLTLSLDNGQAIASVLINDISTSPTGIAWEWVTDGIS